MTQIRSGLGQQDRPRNREVEVEQPIGTQQEMNEAGAVPVVRREPKRGVLEMQAIRTGKSYTSRSRTSVSTALVFVLTFCVSAMVARAQVPASGKLVVSQSTKLGALPGGGSQSGTVPAGDTMAVTSFGGVITTDTYGGDVELFSAAGVATKLGSYSNANGVAVDSQNNLYIGGSYNSQVVKLPYVNGAYVALAATSGTTPNCTGSDTAECVMSQLTTGGADVVSMLFD